MLLFSEMLKTKADVSSSSVECNSPSINRWYTHTNIITVITNPPLSGQHCSTQIYWLTGLVNPDILSKWWTRPRLHQLVDRNLKNILICETETFISIWSHCWEYIVLLANHDDFNRPNETGDNNPMSTAHYADSLTNYILNCVNSSPPHWIIASRRKVFAEIFLG